MTTSGTLNNANITYDVISLIEMAARRCGVLPGRLSSEEILIAQQELQLNMNAMIMDGIPLWTINKQIFGLSLNQYILQFPAGTVDLINVLYRFNNPPVGGLASSSAGGNAANAFDQNLLTFCTQTSINGNISYTFGTGTVVATVGMLMRSTKTLNPVYEYSQDGATWVIAVPAASAPSSYVAGQWYWQDVLAPVEALYFRVRETSGGTLDVTELVFGSPAREITISRTNRDDYQNLPNKNFQGRVLQYWFDRQIIPQAFLWPASNYWLDTLVVWNRQEIQDVGTFQNTLNFPQRWLDYIVSDLAARIAMIIPGVDMTRVPLLQSMAQAAKMRAWTEERDASPFLIQPQIGCYTGGNSYGGTR